MVSGTIWDSKVDLWKSAEAAILGQLLAYARYVL